MSLFLNRFSRALNALGAIIGAAALVFLFLFIILEISLRMIFHTSTFMVDTIVGYAVQAIIFGTLGYALASEIHIRSNFLVAGLNKFGTWIADIVATFAGLLTVTFLLQYIGSDGMRRFNRGSMTDTYIPMPEYISQLIVSIGLAILWVALLDRLVRLIQAREALVVPEHLEAEL